MVSDIGRQSRQQHLGVTEVNRDPDRAKSTPSTRTPVLGAGQSPRLGADEQIERTRTQVPPHRRDRTGVVTSRGCVVILRAGQPAAPDTASQRATTTSRPTHTDAGALPEP